MIYKVYYFMYNRVCSRLFQSLSEAVCFANNSTGLQNCIDIVKVENEEQILELFEIR